MADNWADMKTKAVWKGSVAAKAGYPQEGDSEVGKLQFEEQLRVFIYKNWNQINMGTK